MFKFKQGPVGVLLVPFELPTIRKFEAFAQFVVKREIVLNP